MKLRICLSAVLFALLATTAAAREAPPASDEARALIAQLGLQESATPSREHPRWAPPQHIALTPIGDPAQQQRLLEAVMAVAGDAEVYVLDPDDPASLAEADVVVARCTPDIVAAAPRLRYLHSVSVGVDRCTLSGAIAPGDFILTNNQRGMGPDIAEHAIALLLALTRNLDFYVREQQAGRWSRGQRQAVNVNGKTMLVLGLGGIGTEIAHRANGLGMRVIATRNSSREAPDFVDYVGLSDETLALANQADAVVNALPLTEDTQGLIGAEFFAALKPGAFYVSVGRGATTDTDALIAALESGRLAGAGLDVTDPEPLPEGHPLWGMENVVITPHISARTDEVSARMVMVAIENLRRYTQGEPLLNVVDIERGY